MAQERAVQQREVAADADEAVTDIAPLRQRGVVSLDDDPQDVVEVARFGIVVQAVLWDGIAELFAFQAVDHQISGHAGELSPVIR
ncbi:hypothetical protein ACFXOD_36910 [Streptomyces sp. NPDC059161]|uniref:hypothetical protein n=1 Tax=Streptomyces sp. NPDC059161 TaxID=3346749 RepID=UPI0036A73BAE